MTFIILIANYWTEHTPFWATYGLTFVGDLMFLALLTNPTIKHKTESKSFNITAQGDKK